MQKQKALVVDDSPFQVEILTSMLNELGITAVTAKINGIEALTHFEEVLGTTHAYTLVFLDIVMPQMDGQEALRRIRTLEKAAGISGDAKAIIIMTTSLDSPQDMVKALLDGDCDDYLVKPLNEEDLKRVLSRLGVAPSTP